MFWQDRVELNKMRSYRNCCHVKDQFWSFLCPLIKDNWTAVEPFSIVVLEYCTRGFILKMKKKKIMMDLTLSQIRYWNTRHTLLHVPAIPWNFFLFPFFWNKQWKYSDPMLPPCVIYYSVAEQQLTAGFIETKGTSFNSSIHVSVPSWEFP